jgi:hypothetical protein
MFLSDFITPPDWTTVDFRENLQAKQPVSVPAETAISSVYGFTLSRDGGEFDHKA